MIPTFRGLNPYFATNSLDSFEYTVLRVLLQLESPQSDHRNSRYVLKYRDYSVFKQNQKLSEHSSPLNAFLSTKGSDFGLDLLQGNMFYKSSLRRNWNHLVRISDGQNTVMGSMEKKTRQHSPL